MRRGIKKKIRKIIVTAILGVSMLLCCSCGDNKKDVEYFGTEENGTSGGDAANNGHAVSAAPIAEQIGAENKWTERVKNSNAVAGYINVNAIVDTPDTNIINVAEAKLKTYNEEEQKEILKTLGMGNATLEKSEFNGKQSFEYTSEQDGRIYRTGFSGNNFSYVLTNVGDTLDIEEGYSFSPLVRDRDERTDYGISENQCELTKDEVEDIAYDFVKKLGLKDFEIAEINAKAWQMAKRVDSEEEAYTSYQENGEWVHLGESKTIYNGAEVKLFRRIEGMQLTPMELYAVKNVYDEAYDMYVGVTADGAPVNEKLTLTITEAGVVSAYYDNAIEGVEITDRNVELASYPDICASLKENLEKYEADMQLGSFTDMKLMYYGVEPEDGKEKCEIVPAWVLMVDTYFWIAVDARDGSVICTAGW
ncbi:MAG: hypothetical protein NC225_12545 [Clostridium sp.]|nr:hypothetical protein [Clostridium sp.]MCM1400299.1 hypothetical protein [Clostridium sp.]MCM1461022.1 hypothetical protein [Bacteroides sp.]